VSSIDLTFGDIPMPGDWVHNARCRQSPGGCSIFFPQTADAAAAKSVCRGCPVRGECLDYAMANPDLHGIWGGTTRAERDRERDRLIVGDELGPRPAEPSRSPLAAVLTALVAFPGRWAWVARYHSPAAAASIASQLRSRRRYVPPGEWSFEGRMAGGGSDLYARFDGLATSPAVEPDRPTQRDTPHQPTQGENHADAVPPG